MIFRHFLLNVNESNAFLIACETTREALLVDAGEVDPRIEDFLREQELRLVGIFITHDHFDHTGGLEQALALHDVVVYSGEGIIGGEHARKVAHGDPIRVGDLEGTVLATPGHTPDSLSLTFPGLVFTGDALFSGSIGGVSRPRDGMTQVEHIRKHIFALPGDCEIYPGHGPASTVDIERRFNPFFA